MPKMKTHRGAAKRFRKTGKGKYKYKPAGHRHNQSTLTKAARRSNRQSAHVAEADQGALGRLLPNG